MEDSPGLEVGNRLLDDVTDPVDLGVEFFLPIEELSMGGFLNGGEHVVSDVSFVTDPGGGIECDKDVGFLEAIRIVAAAFDRVRDPRELTVKGAGDLDVHSCSLVLA